MLVNVQISHHSGARILASFHQTTWSMNWMRHMHAAPNPYSKLPTFQAWESQVVNQMQNKHKTKHTSELTAQWNRRRYKSNKRERCQEGSFNGPGRTHSIHSATRPKVSRSKMNIGKRVFMGPRILLFLIGFALKFILHNVSIFLRMAWGDPANEFCSGRSMKLMWW